MTLHLATGGPRDQAAKRLTASRDAVYAAMIDHIIAILKDRDVEVTQAQIETARAKFDAVVADIEAHVLG